ncbi:MAG TPA: flagellar motor protein MotA [Xanthobacteraceae bacterium]|nr:flagellar motor protein MotA [Xanthobacteraceae bacterium]
MARDDEHFVKVSSPRIFLFRMIVFLVLAALLAVLLHRQIWSAFLANPALNGIILGSLAVGILMSIRQVIRLFPEVRWVNGFRRGDPGLAVNRPPVLLAPMATLLGGDRVGRMAISQTTMRGILDSIGTRLDESREIARYLTGLLVFLGLLGTFWGLLETIGSIGQVISSLEGGADSSRVFEDLKSGLAAPLSGMGIAFSSSLFGLAGSLILGFLDLQAGQAQNRFYTDLEDWLSTTVRDLYVGEAGAGVAARMGEYLPSTLVDEFAAAIDRFENTLKARGSGGGVDATSMAGLTAVVHRLEQALKPLGKMPEVPVEQITAAIGKLERVVEDSGGQRATSAMVKLAESLQSLVQHMRNEQQMLRDWVEAQADQQNDIRELLKRLARTQAGERA